ncbi:MAG: M48 family metallopeptidase [Nitrospiraceae bacterium]|nr:M48 family metallopeptidase [Nitrospiraceae bacterium]
MKTIVLLAFLVVVAVGYWLKYLNLSHLKAHGHEVPPEFAGAVDPATLAKMSDYTVEHSRFGLIESLFDNAVLILFLFGGLLAVYDRWILRLTNSFLWDGVLFALVLSYIQTVIGAPFSLYSTFRIENKYGFNTMTIKLWITDLLKELAIGTVIGAVMVSGALLLVTWSSGLWWLWVWLFFLVVSVFLMYISPVLIEPLFFKFEPLKVEGLEDRIRQLMDKAGLRVSRVFQVDASKRSKHSNAYFTGIGKVKRIVLFDTLLEQMTQEEILAVLAHEVGHWKKKHVLKRIIMTEAMAFIGLYLAYLLIKSPSLPAVLGMGQASFFARVVILGFLSSIILFPLTPLFSWLSRKDEHEADRFAVELTGDSKAMASALVKLTKENLSNLHPHPLYAAFYYSHPPVVERIRSLRTGARSQ